MSARSSVHQYEQSKKSGLGWGIVVGIHVLVLYLLITGMAQKGLKIISKPLTATVIQEVIIPPPPPPPKKIEKPQPDMPKTMPMPFVPPPEVQAPTQQAPTITAVTAPPPPAPAVIAPPAPKGLTGKQDIGIVCPKQVRPEMPVKAIRDNVEGVVRAQILVQNGDVKEVTILSGPRVFHAAVKEAMMQYKCKTETDAVTATQEFSFKLD